MAYVPPHKRHSNSKDGNASNSTASLAPHFNKSLSLGQPQRRKDRGGATSHKGFKITYAAGAISRWWPVGSRAGYPPIPDRFRLDPVPCDPVDPRTREEPLVLCCTDPLPEESGEIDKTPWVSIAKRVVPDLVYSALRAREESGPENQEIKLSFVARIGKVHFDRNESIVSVRKVAGVTTDSWNQLRKSFYNNVPDSYMEDIQHLVVPKIGFAFEAEKEHYLVKVCDKSQPNYTISCKCTVAENGKEIEIHKIELNRIRHLVVDLSCLYKDLDLRLMLATKRILKGKEDEEKDSIEKLIKSAIIDPNVKGGLRWPLGKDSISDRFNVVGVWHTKYKAFRGSTVRLKIRVAERFDHFTSTREVSNEVSLKLPGISKKLREGDLETEPLMDMVQQEVKVIWDHFLSCSHQLA